MYSAIYYPGTDIRTENLLKTALLLWDDIRCIRYYGANTIRSESGIALHPRL